MTKPITVDDKTFDELVVKAKAPVLVDFWASWCAPCRAIAPIVEELAEGYGSRVNFAKLNVDENPKTATAYGIRSIPTLLLFKNGQPLKQIIGLRSKGELRKELDSVLS